MNPVKFVSEHKRLAGSNAVLRLTVVLLFIGLVINAFISYSMSKRVRTVILPPVVDEKIELSGTKFSDSYLRLMSRYVTGLARNYTPSSARGNFDELLDPVRSFCIRGEQDPTLLPREHDGDGQGDERMDARYRVVGRGETGDHRPGAPEGVRGGPEDIGRPRILRHRLLERQRPVRHHADSSGRASRKRQRRHEQMKRGLLSVSLMALVCLISPVLADDTCGPAGCDAAKAAPAPPVPSVVQSNWKKAVLPQDASKPPAIATKPMQPPAQPPAKDARHAPASSRTLDSGFSEQELLPDPMSLAQKVSPEITTQVRLSNSDINRVICPVDIKDVIYSEEKGLAVNLSGKNAYREVPRGEEGRKGDVFHDSLRALFRMRRRGLYDDRHALPAYPPRRSSSCRARRERPRRTWSSTGNCPSKRRSSPS